MQAATDQRAREGSRVPLDLWIRLAHEDYEDDFDADGVDLSTGGIALRSDYLPEVGDRLRCRFDHPPSGGEIEVDGQVVWAHDAGDRSGEFGLCFGRLDEQVQESLRELVTHLGGNAGAVTRLHLDGVATPIEAEVLERDARWLTVEQELPFLEIGMGVTIENGGGAPRGRLASVDLRIDDGTPRLVLSVELDNLEEDTFDEPEEVVDQNAIETLDPPDEHEKEAAWDGTLEDYDLPEELREAQGELEPLERDEVKIFTIEPDMAEDDGREREAITPGDLMAAPDDRLRSFQTRLAPFVAKVKNMLVAAGGKMRPALAAAWAKLVSFFGMVVAKSGPKAKALWTMLRGLASKVRIPKAKRRTTAAPPRKKRVAGAPRRRQQQPNPEPSPRRNGRRILALSILAFAGVGAAVYALADSGEEPELVEIPAAASAPAPAAAPEALPAPVAPAPAPVAAPAPATAAPDAELAVAPEPQGGRLAEPSYPSLRDGAASGPVSEGQSFGAASVSDARSATIRMSQPVTSIRGTQQSDGFSVTIPGALALDRAGPIAAANPSVERAMILNRGDHAVLTVRFVSGRNPTYRVVARGRAIVIDIGR